METRSRKRAEAIAQRPSSAQSSRVNKRTRLSSAFASAASIPPRSRLPIRPLSGSTIASLRPELTSVDLEMESSGSASKREQDGKGIEKANEKERAGGISNNDSDEDHEDEGVSSLQQTASSALEGLLRKLGARRDDLLPASIPFSQQSSRLKRILSGLRAEAEIGRQTDALTQLCEILSISTEDSLSSFSVDSFVPVLVTLLNHESNPEIMLLAARALTHLCDVLPQACVSVVHYGAVPSFCDRLLTIEYMDLAEQSLEALEKISHEHPTACLRAGALMAVLSYLEFFSSGVQRVALSTAANICKKLPSDAADFVMDAVPILTNLLQFHDSKVVEHASVCLTRIVESFASSSEKLDELCNHGLVTQAARLISVGASGSGQASLSTSTYTGLIRILSKFAGGSALAAKTLLDLNISSIVRDVLTGSSLVPGMSGSLALDRPTDQMHEIVTLLNELLPPLPEGTISLPPNYSLYSKGPATNHVPDNNTGEDLNGTMREISTREKLLRDQPELLLQFGMDLFPVLVQVYGSSVNTPIRHKSIAIVSKLVYFSTAEMLISFLHVTNISSFLAGVLAWKDPHVLVPALQIAEVLIKKLPDTFPKLFVKEGVVHAIDTLISADLSSSSSVQVSASQKDCLSGSAVCNILHSDRSNSEITGEEESRGSNAGRVGSPLPSGDETIPIIKTDLRSTICAHAKQFKDTYFPANSRMVDGGMTESLCNLKSLCMKLSNELEGKDKEGSLVPADDEQLLVILAEILAEFVKGDGVSTFEFVESGVIASLLNYFSCGALSKQNMTDAESTRVFHQALKRFKLFTRLALPVNAEDDKETPLTILIHKLQDALSSSERFPVILSHARRLRGGNVNILAGLSALSQPVKLRFCRAEGETSLQDYSSNMILIDSLANLAAVEEFLWPRIQIGEASLKSSANLSTSDGCAGDSGATDSLSPSSSVPGESERPLSIRPNTSVARGSSTVQDLDGSIASSSKGKEKAVSKLDIEEAKASQTRTAPFTSIVADRVSQSRQPQRESGPEEENLDVSPVEMDESVAMEEDISEDEDDEYEEHLEERLAPASMMERVHDVQLGDHDEIATTVETASQPSPGVDSRSNMLVSGQGSEFLTDVSLVSRGSLSFARAAMSRLVSISFKGARGSRDSQTLPVVDPTTVPPRLNFFMGGKQLDRSLTIYQAIQRQAGVDEEDDKMYTGLEHSPVEGRRLWDEVYNITYQRIATPEEKDIAGESAGSSSPRALKNSTASSSRLQTSWERLSFLDSILQGELPCDLEKSNCTYDILLLLRVLECLNQLSPRLRALEASDAFAEGKIINFQELKVKGPVVPQKQFLSSKLTPKLARQMQDPLAVFSGGLPSWCNQLTKACPFLFPFETRRQYFYSASFGLSRALQRLQQQQSAENSNLNNNLEVRVGRVQRQKVRVYRHRILDSAMKVMEMYGSHKAVLEVEYFGEVGTGLGPTLEFYTLLSHELQKKVLGMWRSGSCSKEAAVAENVEMWDVEQHGAFLHTNEVSKIPTVETEEFVQSPQGLFPRPWPPNANSLQGSQFSKAINYFHLLGQVMAKALQDGRLLDLPLSTAFYKLVLMQELDLFDIQSFDRELGTTLQEMDAFVRRKQFLESLDDDNGKALSDLLFHNARIDDLCLDFTLPGYPDYVLKSEGNNIMVHIDNLEEYISLVVDATVKTGIMPQVEAFRAGFNQVFSLSSLQIFTESELESLLCGGRELWAAQSLVDQIKFDHGYTSNSPSIVNLLEILGEFTPEQQGAFLRFVTGAPRLPPGGLAALNPKLTIVRKHSTGANGGIKGTAQATDRDLPSVMTCANYLKLPPYSCKEVMRERLMYAITEGQGSFDLS